jgi:asparagine synthase (glutamine-hydrolysing)
MCGIAGIVWQDPARPGDAAAARAMVAALTHRGPDGEGVEVLGPAALGHRRLSIIDVSEAGRQPLSNEDGTVWLTFNGEIYNYRELRAGLEARGHTFRSQTDSEVLVHLYEEKGAELVHDLVGMFAFAIWDVTRQRLLLARDRAGQKPLHVRLDDQALRFASEPAALLADPTAPAPEADPVAIHHYVHYGYVPSPLSAFAGVQKLAPAHLLEWRPGQPPVTRRYWTPSFRDKHDASTPTARRRLLGELEGLLTESVRYRLISDVPLGAFLSGGIDSGLIVATMANLLSDPVRTFTIGFEQEAYDERSGARLVAERYRTQHLERVVPAEAGDLLTRLVRHYGEPFADSSAIPTYRLAELTRKHVTVALSGDAGDELFAGYLRHTANEAARYYGLVPRLLRRGIHGVIEALPHRPRPHDPLRYAKRFLRSFEQDVAGRNAGWGLVIKPETASGLYAPGFAEQVGHVDATDVYRRHFHAAQTDDEDERVLWADFALYLPDDILVKVDIATMAHGLEARAPLLDHRLIEWAMRLPFSMKSSLGRRKRILRDLAALRLPKELVNAPKRGFAVPLDDWFRGPLLPMFRDLVLAPDARTRGVFATPVVEDLLAQHQARAWDWQHELWAILWLELWYREMLPASG